VRTMRDYSESSSTPYREHGRPAGAATAAAASYYQSAAPAVRMAACAAASVVAAATIISMVRSSPPSGVRPALASLIEQTDIGTCDSARGTLPKDCDHVDYGTCGASCCAVEVAVPNIDPLEAYQVISKSLSSGGPDGRYSKVSTSDDVQSELPFSFSPPLPWRFTISGRHSTAGSWNSVGAFRPGFEDTLRFSTGVASDVGALGMTRVRMFSLSGPSSALVDFGQNFKSLSLLAASLGWPAPSPTFGCGLGQAVAWKPANSSTVALQNRDGVCLDAKQRNKNGGVVQMWDCDPTNLNQLWKLDAETGLIKNVDGVCLSDASAGNTPGGGVVTWACDPTLKNQQWTYEPVSGQVKARHGALCLDASERHNNGGKVVMWTCDTGNQNQQWNARRVQSRRA